MKSFRTYISLVAAFTAIMTLSSCGGAGGGGTTPNVPSATYSIMGIVSGAPQGTTVTLSGTANKTTTTNSIGYYQFTGLASSGSYSVTVSLTGYTFSPATRSVAISSANAPNTDFSVINTYGVASTVKTGSGTGVPGTTITLVNSTGVATTRTSDATGVYSAVGLAAGTYTVSASKAGYAFNPLNQKTSVTCDVNTDAAFAATATLNTYSITGTVMSGGTPVVNAKLTLSNANSGIVYSDASGTYAFSGLTNGSYTITASKIGSAFSAACNTTINNADPSPCDFTVTGPGPAYMPPSACVDLSGTISGAIWSGVSVTVNYFLTQSSPATAAATDVSGNYLVSIPSSSYVITPSMPGFTFSPPRICGVSICPANPTSVPGNNFTSQ